MMRKARTVVGAALILAICSAAVPAQAAPLVQRACHSIHVNNRNFTVDVEWAKRKYRWRTSCRMARGVSKQYLRRSNGRIESLTVRYGGRKYDCYKSRSDGQGWDYNCIAVRNRSRHNISQIGIGRRF